MTYPKRPNLLFVPVSIRNTLKRHRMSLEDVLSFEKLASVLPDQAIVDLMLAQGNLYSMMPADAKSMSYTGDRPGEPLKLSAIRRFEPSKDGNDLAFPMTAVSNWLCLQLDTYFSNQSKTTELKERFEKRIMPLLKLGSTKEEYDRFVDRTFRKKQSDESHSDMLYSSATDDIDTQKGYSLTHLRDDIIVITFMETAFPSLARFEQLITDLLDQMYRLTGYAEMASQMKDLFTFYLNRLDEKHR